MKTGSHVERAVPGPVTESVTLTWAGNGPSQARDTEAGSVYRRAQAWLFAILETAHEDPIHRIVAIVISATILINLVAVILETVASLAASFEDLFLIIEGACVMVFTVEYVLRFWACTSDPRYRGPIRGRLRFATSPLALIDLLAIVPFYVPYLATADPMVVRLLRLVRLLRVLKLAHYSAALQRPGRGLDDKKEELLVALGLVLGLLVVASTLIYAVEHEAQPQAFSSIPASLWWGATTLTTVAYGDVYPVTPVGKFIASIIAILGVGMFALPAGILASAFGQQTREAAEAKAHRRPAAHDLICPHCGAKVPAAGDEGARLSSPR